MRARSLVLTAWRRERACGELSADRRFLAGHAGVETRTSVQVLAARQKSSFGRPAGLQLAYVDLECRRNLTVCWCLRTVEGVPTLRSSVPPIGDCVRGVRFRVRQLRSTHRGNTEGYGMCMLSRARAYLRADPLSRKRPAGGCISIFRTRMFIFTKRFSVTHTRNPQLGCMTLTGGRVNGVS